jgi:hypothetical protein
MDWKPRPGQPPPRPLTEAERACLAHVDGETSAEDIALLTGLRRVEVAAVLDGLVRDGVVTGAAHTHTPPTQAPHPQVAHVQEGPDATTLASAAQPPPEGEAHVAADQSGAEHAASDGSASSPSELTDDGSADSGSGASHLALYRAQFHPLRPDERAAIAATAMGANLSALCFDPVPEVIRHLLGNPHTGLEQARLIASHHHTTTGLEFLFSRADLLRDTQVQRLLVRNPQLAEGQLKRLVGHRRLLELWKLTTSREVTSQTRTATMRLLRQRFAIAPAEERVELIFTSEGRALNGLAGLPIDGKTTALLCARTYASTLLVTNLATWSSTPPALITHLLRQPVVMRQPALKTRLQQHPNAPSTAR